MRLLLKYRPRTEEEAKHRLQDKDFSEEVISRLIDWGKATGNLDDKLFAQYFVEDRLQNKPTGRSGLYKGLLDYGVDPQTAKEVLDRKLSDSDELKECKNLAKKRLKRYEGEDVKAKYRKTSAFLVRRGFSKGEVKQVLKEILFNDG